MKRIMSTDIRNILAVITSLGSFVIIYLLIIKQIPEPNHDIVIAGVGYILGAANGMVYGYYFGAAKAAPGKTPIDERDEAQKK